MALDITALESALGTWSFAGYFTTAIVAVGCLGESIVEFTNCIRPRSLAKKIGAAAAIVLIAGLGGEVLTQVKVNSLSGQIIAVLNDEVAEANAREKEAELALAKLKEPRVLSNDDSLKLVQALLPYKSNNFWIITQSIDPDLTHTEQGLFSIQISGVLSRAGWKKDSHWSQQDPGRADSETEPLNDRGCHVAYSVNLQSAGEKMVGVLKAAGIGCEIAPDSSFRPSWLVIEIGLR